MHKCTSLITTIFSDHNQVKVIEDLAGTDAQTFIDIVDEVSPHTISHSKGKLMDLDSNPCIFQLDTG
jgi:hypothetical protein